VVLRLRGVYSAGVATELEYLVKYSTIAFPTRTANDILMPLLAEMQQDFVERAPDDVKAARISRLSKQLRVLDALIDGVS
jgi:hypothetical protein